jgi:four helix bundle protein
LVTKNEYVLSKQILKSGTSIGANIHEALAGFSKRDFEAKMEIVYKESVDNNELAKMLTAIVKQLRKVLNRAPSVELKISELMFGIDDFGQLKTKN